MAGLPSQTLSQAVDRAFQFTRDAVLRRIDDHAFNHSPIVAIYFGKLLGEFGRVPMNARGRDIQTGGNSVIGRVNLAEHAGAKRMSGPNDTHNVGQDDNVRFAQANWKHYSGNLTITDYDKLVNRGAEAISNLIEFQTQQAILSVVSIIAQDLLSTASPANAITSIDALVSANDTVQLIAGATHTNFNSRGTSARGTAVGSIAFTGGSFVATGIANWRRCFNNASEGAIQPNVIINAYDVQEWYEAALQPQERFTQTKLADAGFMALAFKGRPCIPDDNCSSGYTYMLNTDYLRAKVLAGAEFQAMPFKPGSNQETHVSEIQLKANMLLHNRKYQNKVTTQTA